MKNVKQNEQQVNAQVDLLDIILDRENCDPITLMGDNGMVLTFQQVAVIPYDIEGQDRALYVVLKPIDHIDGVAEDESFVFRVIIDDSGKTVLKLESDDMRAIDVFNKYYDLLEELEADKKKKNKL